jgi:hypothetical protein
MSENKFKYFTVTTTAVVKANNKADAEKIAMSNRRTIKSTPGELLYKDMDVDRITAVQARENFTV